MIEKTVGLRQGIWCPCSCKSDKGIGGHVVPYGAKYFLMDDYRNLCPEAAHQADDHSAAAGAHE